MTERYLRNRWYVAAWAHEIDSGPLARTITNNRSTYKSILVVRRDDPAQTLEDLRGRVVAFTYSGSTSGHVFPRAFLRNQGIVPEALFAATPYAGSHLAALVGVAEGRYDAVVEARPTDAVSGAGSRALEVGRTEIGTAAGFYLDALEEELRDRGETAVADTLAGDRIDASATLAARMANHALGRLLAIKNQAMPFTATVDKPTTSTVVIDSAAAWSTPPK